jgi:antitoxin ChpS
MTTVTLRRWGGAIAVSLPRKVLALLGLDAGATLSVAVEDGRVVLAPVARGHSLAQLLKEQAALERRTGARGRDLPWQEGAPRGRESL